MDERTVDWKCSRLLGRIVHWNRLNCLPDYVIVCPMSGMDNEDRLRVVGIFEKLVGKHGIECEMHSLQKDESSSCQGNVQFMLQEEVHGNVE